MARNSRSKKTRSPAPWQSAPTRPASRSRPSFSSAPMTRRARSAGAARAQASRGASISRPTAKSSPSPTTTAQSAGCAGKTAEKDGGELLALFVEPQSRKWVAWTPSGYYMASAGGEDLIGWHVNRGWDQEAGFFRRVAVPSAIQSARHRPRSCYKTRDEAEAVSRANAAAERLQSPLPPPCRQSFRSYRPRTDRIFPATRSKSSMCCVRLPDRPSTASTRWPTASLFPRPGSKRRVLPKPRAVSRFHCRNRTRPSRSSPIPAICPASRSA